MRTKVTLTKNFGMKKNTDSNRVKQENKAMTQEI